MKKTNLIRLEGELWMARLVIIVVWILSLTSCTSKSVDEQVRDFTPIYDNLNGTWVEGDPLMISGMQYLVSPKDRDLCDNPLFVPKPGYCFGLVAGDPYVFGKDEVNLCHLPVEIQPGYCGEVVADASWAGASGKYGIAADHWPGAK